MANPQYSAAPNAGNLIASATSLPASGNFCAYFDASTDFEAQISGVMKTGASVSTTAGVTASCYHVYAQTTLSAAATAGSSVALSVASAAGIQAGQTIVVDNEIVSVTAVSGTTVTVATLARNHANGAGVYVIEQTPSASVQLASPGGAAYAANTVYSKTLYVPTSRYVYAMANLDATNAVTIEATLDLFTGIA